MPCDIERIAKDRALVEEHRYRCLPGKIARLEAQPRLVDQRLKRSQ
jgi:hypothetical protein